jgi:transcriptional regulator GlxA family with amidase domain
MPEILVVRATDAARRPGLAATLDQLDREVANPDVGGSRVVSLLLEVLFVQVLRFWLDERPADRADWLGALRDPAIGRVLVRVHQAPERPWTVASMAALAGMSRAVFARRFHARVGQPPLSYVAQLRIEAATGLLRGSDLSLAQIADAVGYSSEYAFNRAFRRATGSAPGRWRRAVRRIPEDVA